MKDHRSKRRSASLVWILCIGSLGFLYYIENRALGNLETRTRHQAPTYDSVNSSAVVKKSNVSLIVDKRKPKRRKPSLRTETPKRILLWNPFFQQSDYGVGLGTTVFQHTNCSKTCYLTDDTRLLPVADAVVVHVFNMGPPFRNYTLPKRTRTDQIFVFFILESPLKSVDGFTLSGYDFTDLFNLTVTYMDHPETDILVPIGSIQERLTRNPARAVNRSDLHAKTKQVVWIVSNCNPPGSRNDYVRELSKHIQVDIYGACGDNFCNLTHHDCFDKLLREYRFYLSFENTYCSDYVTEKVFRTLNHSFPILPIVLGGGQYKNVLPPHSFIDVRDYSSPRKLALKLRHLSTNHRAYRRYFNWRPHYDVYAEKHSRMNAFCRLCEILHTDGYPYKSNYDPVRYWDPNKHCQLGKEERKTVHLI